MRLGLQMVTQAMHLGLWMVELVELLDTEKWEVVVHALLFTVHFSRHHVRSRTRVMKVTNHLEE